MLPKPRFSKLSFGHSAGESLMGQTLSDGGRSEIANLERLKEEPLGDYACLVHSKDSSQTRSRVEVF